MKKLIDFLSAPIVNLIFGLLLYLWLGCCFWLYDAFDRKSAFYGGLFVIVIDITFYGLNALMDKAMKDKHHDDSSPSAPDTTKR